jgi:hypothetical protein
MATDLHVLACLTPGGECIECMSVFRAVRKYLNAATPKIEAEVRRLVADEIGQAIEDCEPRHTDLPDPDLSGPVDAADAARFARLMAYDHAAGIARFHAMPDCGSEFHGADGGPCPRCGFDVAGPVEGRSWPVDAEPAEVSQP